MSDKWYYVQSGNRHGPVPREVIQKMITKEEIKGEDFVWKKGFESWKKINEVQELRTLDINANEDVMPPELNVSSHYHSQTSIKEWRLGELSDGERNIYIRTGLDRGTAYNDYGPYSPKQIKLLFKEKRINGKTLIFLKGSNNWKMLADFSDYQEFFEELPPLIKESDRRASTRKPFIARLLIQHNKNLIEGICRDVSIGGMQVLVDKFTGVVGEKISINVHPENTDYHFVASGIILRILEGNSGFSFRFQNLSEEAKRAIEKYIQEN